MSTREIIRLIARTPLSASPVSLFQSIVVDLQTYAMGQLEQSANTTGQFLTE